MKPWRKMRIVPVKPRPIPFALCVIYRGMAMAAVPTLVPFHGNP